MCAEGGGTVWGGKKELLFSFRAEILLFGSILGENKSENQFKHSPFLKIDPRILIF